MQASNAPSDSANAFAFSNERDATATTSAPSALLTALIVFLAINAALITPTRSGPSMVELALWKSSLLVLSCCCVFVL